MAFLGMLGTEYVGVYPFQDVCSDIPTSVGHQVYHTYHLLDISHDRWHLEMSGTFSVRGIYFYRMCTLV